MADIEVCVDRIADSRIKDMNLCLDEARKKIVQQYHPDEDDTMLRTLDVARIDDEILFANTVHRDLDAIVRDIREAHVSDTTTRSLSSGMEPNIFLIDARPTKVLTPLFYNYKASTISD